MNEKVFEFYGLDFKIIIIGLLWFFLIMVFIFGGLVFLFGTDIFQNYYFTTALTVFILIALFKFYGRYYKKLWKIVFTDEIVKVYFGGKLKSSFALSELRKIHINGWFRDLPKGSYRWLRLTTESDKFIILMGDTNLINTSNKLEIKSFDNFFSVLEAYATGNNYVKTDLKKSYHDSFGKNYFYSRK